MAEAVRNLFTREQFEDWIAGQEVRHELVHGEAVAMAGANRRHDLIAGNTFLAIGNQLRGKPCRPFTSDTYVNIPAGNLRLPDLGVDCGRFVDDQMAADAPALVVEILSKSTREFDRFEKIEEYKTVPTLKYILLIDPDSPQVRLHRRIDGDSWASERLAGLEIVIEMPPLGLKLALSEIYEGLRFRPRPVPVDPDDPTSRFAI